MPNISIGAGGIGALAVIVAGVYVVNKFGDLVSDAGDKVIDAAGAVLDTAGNAIASTAPVKVAVSTYNNGVAPASESGAFGFFGDILTIPFNMGAEILGHIDPIGTGPSPGAVAEWRKTAESYQTFSDVSSGKKLYPEYYNSGYIASNEVPGTFSDQNYLPW